MQPIGTRRGLRGIGLILLLAGAISITPAVHAQGIGTEVDHAHALALDHQEHVLYLGTHHGLARSQDAGKTWTTVDMPGEVPRPDIMALAIDPTNPHIVYAAGHGLWVIKSTDGGTTWAVKKQGLEGDDVHALALDPNDPRRVYAWVVDKGLYRSTNGGENWARVDDGPLAPGGHTPADVKGFHSINIPTGMGGIYLAAATASGLFVSADCF
jgi:photosystem II stability/assembly factor-like uncharacterized protein